MYCAYHFFNVHPSFFPAKRRSISRPTLFLPPFPLAFFLHYRHRSINDKARCLMATGLRFVSVQATLTQPWGLRPRRREPQQGQPRPSWRGYDGCSWQPSWWCL